MKSNNKTKALLTDYPDAELVANLEHNVGENLPGQLRDRVSVKVCCWPSVFSEGLRICQGYIWGRDVQPLLDVAADGFNLIIMSDLVFNHSQVHRPK